MFDFKLTIGDWSDDGHNHKEDYTITCHKGADTIKDIREIHFRTKEHTSLDIGKICSDYGDFRVKDPIINSKITALVSKHFPNSEAEEYLLSEVFTKYETLDSDIMVTLWMAMMMDTEPTLKLALSDQPKLPTLHFYGRDEKGRHIDGIGYGLFE